LPIAPGFGGQFLARAGRQSLFHPSARRPRQPIERRHHPVVIVHRQRLKLVVVAAGAAHRQPEKRQRRRADHVVELIEAIFLRIGGLIVPRTESIVAGGDQRVGVRIGQLIARELFDDEAIERLSSLNALMT